MSSPPLSENGQRFHKALLDFGFPQKMSDELALASDESDLEQYGPADCLMKFLVYTEKTAREYHVKEVTHKRRRELDDAREHLKEVVGAELYNSVQGFPLSRFGHARSLGYRFEGRVQFWSPPARVERRVDSDY